MTPDWKTYRQSITIKVDGLGVDVVGSTAWRARWTLYRSMLVGQREEREQLNKMLQAHFFIGSRKVYHHGDPV